MRISDWSSDVCSSDLFRRPPNPLPLMFYLCSNAIMTQRFDQHRAFVDAVLESIQNSPAWIRGHLNSRDAGQREAAEAALAAYVVNRVKPLLPPAYHDDYVGSLV